MTAAPPAAVSPRVDTMPQARERATGLVGVFVLCLLVGALYAHPLLPHFFSGLPYTHAPQPGGEVVERFPGDYLQFYYHLWLLQDGLFGPTPLFRDPYEFRWGGPQPGWRTYFLPTSLLFVALSPLGTFAAYNAFVLGSFGLTGLAMFLLARQVVGSGWPAVLAGLIFALAPYRYAVLMGGHPAGSAFYLLPLCLWGIEAALRTGRQRFAVAAGLAVLSLALVEPHHAYFVMLVLPAFLAVRMLPPLAELGRSPGDIAAEGTRGGAVRGLPALALLAAAILPVLAGRGLRWWVFAVVWVLATLVLKGLWLAIALALGRLTDLTVDDALRAGLVCLAPLALIGLSPLRFRFDAPRLTSGLLLAAGGLGVLAFLASLWTSPRGRSRLIAAGRALLPLWPLAFLLLAAVGVMWLLKQAALDAVGRSGRSLREIGLFSPMAQDWLVRGNDAAGRSIYPGVAALALAAVGIASGARSREVGARRWIGFLAVLFVLAEVLSLGPNGPGFPYVWLYDVVPYFGFVRQTSKFQVLAFFALALLAAAGLRALMAMGHRGHARAMLAALALAAVVVDYWPARPVGVSLLRIKNVVYDTLEAAPSGLAVYVPIWPGESSFSSLYQFAATLTRRPMLNGYSPIVSRRYIDEVYRPLDHLNRGELTEREYARLRALGVRFLIVDAQAFPSKVSPFPFSFTLHRLSLSPYLDLLVEDPPLWLFALRAASSATTLPLPTHPFGIFFEAERLPRGRALVVEAPGASWGRAVRAPERPGSAEPGYVVFGARVGLPRGSFRMVFRLRGHGVSDVPVARLDAVTDGGTRTLAARRLTGRELGPEYADYAVEFALDRPEWVEFRVFWEGRGEVEVDYLYGLFADQHDPRWVFRNTEFGFVSGPFRRYATGEYLVRFRSRVKRRSDTPVLRLSVVTAHERAVLASRVVRGTDFDAAGEPQEIALPVRLDSARVLEFPIEFLTPGVSVDQISVTPRS